MLRTRHYLVDVGNGTIWKRHVDQMIKSTQSTTVIVDIESEHSVIHYQAAAPVNVDIDTAPSPTINMDNPISPVSENTDAIPDVKRQLNIMNQYQTYIRAVLSALGYVLIFTMTLLLNTSLMLVVS